ncbi:MAG: choice-of-anchor L domain-containing protein [Lewinellaceae bacterium]|nr:choice-of-anchor L domain-containing protein [Lewinellaceae bacterium]
MSTLFVVFFTAYGFHPVGVPSPPPEQVIEYRGDADRMLVFLYKSRESVLLCGLTEGDEYLLNVSPDTPDRSISTTLLESGENALNSGKIKAGSSCHRLWIETHSPQKAIDRLPVWISVSKREGTGSVKPPPDAGTRAPVMTAQWGMPASGLIQNVFIGNNCFEVSGISSVGHIIQSGIFGNGLTSIGLDHGIMLSTGHVTQAPGPNDLDGASTIIIQSLGDPDLEQLLGGGVIRDASVIEFDFVPTGNTLSFRYVFASEEYCEFVGSQFTDVFGFFLSGPGISGPFSNNSKNLAVLPDGTYVGINSVNHNTNTGFYVGNIPAGSPQLTNDPDCAGHPIAGPPSTTDCQYDGYTTILTATADVIPCSTYHLKLAIGDATDYIFDSSVFLEAASFEAAGEGLTSEAIGTVQGTNIIYEGCSGGYFIFVRDGDLSQPLTIPFTITGTATPGSDYTPLPSSITIPAGSSDFQLPVNVLNDLIGEGVETIILNVALSSCSCSQSMITMEIHDTPPISLNIPDQVVCFGQMVTLVANPTGGVPGGFTYNWNTGANTQFITITPPKERRITPSR